MALEQYIDGRPNTMAAFIERSIERPDREPLDDYHEAFLLHAITWPDGRTEATGHASVWPEVIAE